MVELAVLVVSPPGPASGAQAPLVFLPGGPGDSGIAAAEWLGTGPIAANRPLVFFDPRGVGQSTPSLDCPEVEAVAWENAEATDDIATEARRTQAAYRRCASRLDRSVDLDQYDSEATAQDLQDLARLLKWPTFDVFAISYGSVAVGPLLDTPPRALRSIVLDSPVTAPGRSVDGSSTADRLGAAIGRLQSACDAQPRCARQHPDIQGSLERAAQQFNDAPHEVHFNDVAGKPRRAFLTGDDVVRGVFQAMYDPALLAQVPSVLAQLAEGETAIVDALAPALLGSMAAPPEGLAASVACGDQPHDPVDLSSLQADAPLGAALVGADICAVWPVQAPALETGVVAPARVPVLVLAGSLDPITPADDAARLVAELGPKATFVRLADQSHGAIRSPCAGEVIARFLADPSTADEVACLQDQPNLSFA